MVLFLEAYSVIFTVGFIGHRNVEMVSNTTGIIHRDAYEKTTTRKKRLGTTVVSDGHN
jgi:hypothetical protein